MSSEPQFPYSVKEQRGWYMYDWANSAFSTTVVTLFLGPYLTSLAKNAADANGYIFPLGMQIDHRSFWSYIVGISVFMQIIFLPVTGALADYSTKKKFLLGATAFLGSGATLLMFFLEGANYFTGGILFIVSNLAFGASVVVYNSFLSDIAPPEERDAVSSKGFGVGYLGGGLLLALNLVLYGNAEKFGVSEAMAVRISLASAGAWWALFTVPTLVTLRNRRPALQNDGKRNLLTIGFTQLFRTLAHLRGFPQTLLFLLAYLLYNDAIQTVITLASQFGNDELKIPLSTLTLAILMVQFVAFFGAMIFNWIASRIGTKNAVMLSLVVWTAVLIYIYLSVKTTVEFFIMAAIVAIIMGGSQALSRSLYSLMIPKGKEAEYFGLYEISDKGTSWLCPILFALALDYTHSYRLAILSLIIFFILGLAVLIKVNVPKAIADAKAGDGLQPS
jgi:UMF1 family MFS transporter